MVIGIGVLVAVSTVLQSMQNAGSQGVWRPYVLGGGVVAGVLAAWQLAATVLVSRSQSPEPGAALTEGDPRKVGPYRIVARLGGGAMGRAYLARTIGNHLVAVKVIRSEYAEDTEFRKRFSREIAAVGSIDSPFTTTLLNADSSAVRPWLATTYVPGPSLQQAVDEHGPWPADRVWELTSGVAKALLAIHDAGVVDRDLKPSNILLDAHGPRVIDFGIARAMDASQLTATVNRPGTPAYMAPEQALGREVGPAADVFALGVAMAFVATGRPPFGEGTSDAVLYRVIHQEPDLSAVEPTLRGLLADCVRKDPAQRPTPAQIIARCAPHLGRTPGVGWLPPPVAAELGPPPTAAQRPRRLSLVTAVLAFVVALVSIGIQVTGSGHALAGVFGGASSSPSPSPTASPSATTLGAPNAGRPTHACMVTDTGGINDRSFNASAWKGMQDAAVQNSNIKVDYVQSAAAADYQPNLTQFVSQKCDLIVAVGGLMGDATKAAAQANPNQKFAIVDDSLPLPNVYSMQFDTAQAGFLAGYLSAGYSKSGTVGTYGGLKIPPVTIFMDGLVDGVAYYNKQKNKTVKVLGWDKATQNGSFANSFTDQNAGRSLSDAFVAQGADVIMPVAGGTGLGTAAAAQQSGGKQSVIWVDQDGCVSAQQYCSVFLSTVVKNISDAVKQAVLATANGTLQGGTGSIGTLANNGVQLAPYHDFDSKVPADLKSEIDKLKQDIISGAIMIS